MINKKKYKIVSIFMLFLLLLSNIKVSARIPFTDKKVYEGYYFNTQKNTLNLIVNDIYRNRGTLETDLYIFNKMGVILPSS